MIKDCMDADDKDYKTARRKVRVPIHYAFLSPNSYQVLARDGFRCLLTGYFDRTSVENSPELNKRRDSLGAAITSLWLVTF